MATTYESGSAVLSGYYFNPAGWHVEPIANDGDRLPGGRGRWMRVPTVAALLLVPILGAAFLVFLPLIGFLVALQALAAPVMRIFRRSATDLAATVTPGWQPGESHFTGKPSEDSRVEEEGPSESRAALEALDALAAEIERLRRNPPR